MLDSWKFPGAAARIRVIYLWRKPGKLL